MFDRHLSRRDLIRTGAAAVAAATLPSWALAKDEDPFAGFTVGVQSYTFRNFNLEKAVAKIAECGAKAVEFFNRHVPVDSTPDQIKARYKELVKLHHPDAHGGDKEAEEKLKVINLAYATLKASYFS